MAMRVVSEFFSDDGTKRAVVSLLDDYPVIEFYSNDMKIETRAFVDVTVASAENTAEDYVMGVLKI